MAGKTPQLTVGADVWLSIDGHNLAGERRVALLAGIARVGSITQAAKDVGLSYKGAWNAIEDMGNLAGEPLLARTVGGKGGGSTRLTPRGEKLVQNYELIRAEHARFVDRLNRKAQGLTSDFALMESIAMKTSARNQFVGTVTAVRAGAVNDEVELTLPGGARIVAIVTRESTELLGLRTHVTAFALVASSSVIVATDLGDARLSARNRLSGVVAEVVPGAVNAEVVITLDGGGTIAALVTQASVQPLGLAPGVRATALFKASSVILGVAA